jgi:D-Tyr-tRNA(Tyr) deacylase
VLFYGVVSGPDGRALELFVDHREAAKWCAPSRGSGACTERVRGPYLSSALHSPVHVGRSADTSKGNRPSFSHAARPEVAAALYQRFVEELRAIGVLTKTGVFGARMVVEIANDGPVTIILEA